MMKKILTISLVWLILFSFIYTDIAYAENKQDKPKVSAEAYIAIDAETGRIIVSKNATEKKYMASTTKIMTAILAIDEFNDLNKTLMIPANCTGIEGSSIYLVPNQKAKMIDLLYGLMLRSGNDAAMSVAYFAGNKKVENFIDKMNIKAEELGAYNTHFVNPHGLHDDNHYTTAYDLALITKYALQNEQFREIASAKKYINSDNNFYFINKNKVVYQYKYGTGVKIGYTKTAGRCLVASAKKDDMEIIVVVLNDGNWFNDSYKIFDYAFENYKNYTIVEDEQFMLNGEDNVPVLADDGFKYLLTEDELKQIKIETVKTVPFIENDSDERIYGFYRVCLNDNVLYSGKLKYEY